MKIPNPSDTFKQAVVSKIIEATQTDIILHVESDPILCPVCSGTDAFCATCGGNQYIVTITDVETFGTVLWKNMEQRRYNPLGITMEGDANADLIYTEELEEQLLHTKYVTTNGRKCSIKSWVFGGAPINRVKLILLEDSPITGMRV